MPGREECPIVTTDVVFLFDGSNSLKKRDLENNKRFMLQMMEAADRSTMNFAVVQFSTLQKIEMDFKQFTDPKTDLKKTIKQINLMESVTMTGTAIKFVTDKVFTKEAGAREDATRLLIVITDGLRSKGDHDLGKAIESAKEKGIIRCAIGVGDMFKTDPKAAEELEMIASSPDYLIKVKSYDDLHNIFEGMKAKIYNIEGTQSSSNQSAFEQEMSQSGFSALATGDAIALGSVGSFDWSGGVMEMKGNKWTFLNVSKSHTDMKNSYLGYSLESAFQLNRTSYIVGAPRYRHKGKVVIFQMDANGSQWETRQHILGEQIGSYFGSELCTVDLTGDGETDLLLIGAPLYQGHRIGGIVTVCTLSPEGNYSCPTSLQGEQGNGLGRFGSTIAALRDLNGDGLADVAIGAPLEDGHQGSIYIYHGTEGGIATHYSQRVPGISVSPGLSYFGRSVSGTMDISQDGLTDLAVGALGKVVILRSRPVIDVTASVTHSPGEIALWNFVCPGRSVDLQTAVSNLSICFNVSLATSTNKGDLRANLTYNVKLDSKRLMPRVQTEDLARVFTGHQTVTNDTYCFQHPLLLTACIEDYLSPIEIHINFSFTPLPVEGTKELQPILNEQCTRMLTELLPVEKNCGVDDKCIDNLNMVFHLTGRKRILVGNSSLLEVTITLRNLGEDSYRTRLTLHHPTGLQFRKLTNLQTTQVDCSSEHNTTGNLTRKFSCNISHPIFRSESMAMFTVNFEILDRASWGSKAVIKAMATSDNEESVAGHNVHMETIPVQYGVKIIVSRVSCTRYISFWERLKEQRDVKHTYKVENLGTRDTPVNVTFELHQGVSGVVWWDVKMPIPIHPVKGWDCVEEAVSGPGEGRRSGEHPEGKTSTRWTRISCNTPILERNTSVEFNLVGIAHSFGETVTTEVKLGMESLAHISLDQETFVDIYSPTSHWAQARTEIEFREYYNSLPLVIGGSVGGFLLLILIIIAFYKCGFFNRNFRDKLCDSGEELSSPISTAAVEGPMPDSQEIPESSDSLKLTDEPTS
ncbi:integrin alpha-X-like [Carcharodon carcharias]|uniref:integrin alpha-X-like n=1 Tax=Carcharodon carcharias TaxID=13397 RepID=UPI001B7ECC10|nr:integrin alpha-X-like [Carcharodon carcharias]